MALQYTISAPAPIFQERLQPVARRGRVAWYATLWLIVLLMVGVRLALAWIPLPESFALTVPDDGYYYFTVAHHLVAGRGLTVDGVIPTNGFHPLWLFLITPFWWLSGENNLELPVHLALSLGAIGDGLTMVGVWFLSRQLAPHHPWLGGILVVVYALNPYHIAAAVNGLETSLSLCLFAAFLLIYWRVRVESRPHKTAWLGLGIVTSLLLLARTDYLLVLLPCGLDLLWRQRHHLFDLTWAGIGFVLWLPWLIWNVQTFGSVAQVSGKAYPYYLHTIWGSVERTAGDWLLQEGRMAWGILANLARFSGFGKGIVLLGGAVLLMLLMAFIQRRRGRAFAPEQVDHLTGLLWPTVGAVGMLLAHGLIRWMYVPWYFVPLSLLLVLWFGLGLNWLAAHRVWLAAAFIVIFLGLQVVEGVRLWQQGGMWAGQKAFAQAWMPEGKQLCTQYDVLGISDSGYFGYFLPCRVVNLDGVVNNEVFVAIQEKRFRSYLDETGIDTILINDIVREVVTLNEGPIPDVAPFAPPELNQ